MTKEIYKLYNGEIELEFDSDKHTYTVDEKIVYGATGILQIVAKPALMYWAVNQAIEFLQGALKAGRSYDELELKGLLDTAKFAHRKKKEDAGDLGSLVHEAIEEFAKTQKVRELVNPKAKECFDNFLNWVKEKKVEFIESERKVYSRRYEYAGTMDFLCRIDGKFYVGDIKTSSGIWEEYKFQVAAYQQAIVEELGIEVEGRIIVRVGKDGSFELWEGDGEYQKDLVAFLGALDLYKRVQELKSIKIKKDEKMKGETNNGSSKQT